MMKGTWVLVLVCGAAALCTVSAVNVGVRGSGSQVALLEEDATATPDRYQGADGSTYGVCKDANDKSCYVFCKWHGSHRFKVIEFSKEHGMLALKLWYHGNSENASIKGKMSSVSVVTLYEDCDGKNELLGCSLNPASEEKFAGMVEPAKPVIDKSSCANIEALGGPKKLHHHHGHHHHGDHHRAAEEAYSAEPTKAGTDATGAVPTEYRGKEDTYGVCKDANDKSCYVYCHYKGAHRFKLIEFVREHGILAAKLWYHGNSEVASIKGNMSSVSVVTLYEDCDGKNELLGCSLNPASEEKFAGMVQPAKPVMDTSECSNINDKFGGPDPEYKPPGTPAAAEDTYQAEHMPAAAAKAPVEAEAAPQPEAQPVEAEAAPQEPEPEQYVPEASAAAVNEPAKAEACSVDIEDADDERELAEACSSIVSEFCAAYTGGHNEFTFKDDCFSAKCVENKQIVISRDEHKELGSCKGLSVVPCPADGACPLEGVVGPASPVNHRLWNSMVCKAAEHSVGEATPEHDFCKRIKETMRKRVAAQ